MNKNIKSILNYSGSVYLAQALNIFSIFVIPKFLGPVMMGKFSLIQVYYTYLEASHFGLRYALDKNIPLNIGRKNYLEVENIANIGITFTLFLAIIVDVVIILLSLFLYKNDNELLVGIILTCIAAGLYIQFNNQKIILRAHEEYTKMSKINIVYGFIWALLRILGVIIYGFYGLLIGIVISNILGLFYVSQYAVCKFKIKFDFLKGFFLLKEGMPFFISNFLNIIFRSLDRITIAAILGFKELGYYSIATMMLTFLLILPASINEVLFPGMLKRLAISNDSKSLLNFITRYISITSKLFAVILGSIIIFIPFLIIDFLPKYKPGILAAQVLILICYFTVFYLILQYYLYGTNNFKLLIIPNILSLVVFLIGFLIIDYFHIINLTNIALLMLISSIFITYSIVYFSFKKMETTFNIFFKTFVNSIWPLYSILIAFILVSTIHLGTNNCFKDYLLMTVNEIIFLIISSPILLLAKRELKLL